MLLLKIMCARQSKVPLSPNPVEEKYRQKSAMLYDQYLKERERPALTLDNYQIRYTFVIERPPIFEPYNLKRFEYYRTKYNFLKKTGYYPEISK